jgi:tetratricopeptide (TPR) repeat protein
MDLLGKFRNVIWLGILLMSFGCVSHQTDYLKGEKTDDALPASTAVRWQNFFKAPPGPRERSELEKKLSIEDTNLDANGLLQLARNQIALGKFMQAEASLKAALRKADDQSEVLLEMASLYLRLNRHEQVADLLQQIKRLTNKNLPKNQEFNFRYQYVLALSYIETGERGKGHKILSDLIGTDRSFVPGYIALASSYLADGKLAVAEFTVKRGLDRGKDDPGLFNLMGVIHERNGQNEQALDWYNKALNLSVDFTPALVNRAKLAIKRKDLQGAQNDLTKALLQQPENVPALVSMGIVQRQLGDFESAQASFAKAIATEPHNGVARFNMGVLMAGAMNNPKEAIRLLHEVVQIAGKNERLKTIAKNYINEINSKYDHH